MGCVASRLGEEEEVVSICRERKNQLKLAVEKRYSLANAHYRYCQSLFGVSAAINLFVARHISPPSPFYITFPPPSPEKKEKETVVSNPLFLQQTPTEPTKESIPCETYHHLSSSSGSDSSDDDVQEEYEVEQEPKMEKRKEQVCGYFQMEMPMPMPMPSPQRESYGWDFFNPFMNVARPEVINIYNRISEEYLRVVREQEGIPELEDEDEEEVEIVEEEREKLVRKKKEKEKECVSEVVEKGVECANVRQGEQQQKELTVIDTPVRGRELLEALKDIEDHFVRAYDSGKEVTRMLECNKVHLQSNVEEIKVPLHVECLHKQTFVDAENSTKLIQAIPWRTASSRSSSCKSLVASSSKSSSTTWTEFSNDLFDDYKGMASGSHSLTLGRLYAWEKKLYEEVKDGDGIRKIYERKCNQLRNQDVRGDEGHSVDKTRAAVKDLYSRILVAIRSVETISSNIEKLRDEELEPQIRELLRGMMGTWKIMLESHEIQNKIIFEVKTFSCPTYGKFSNESHRLATLQLETELMNWRSCFVQYIRSQREYIEALYKWLSKFVPPEVEFNSRSRNTAPLPRSNGPPLLAISYDWLNSINHLPQKTVSYALKSCVKDVRALWVQQGEEHQQKRKVDSLSKELDKRNSAFQKSENRAFEFRLTDKDTEPAEIDQKIETLTEKKDALESFRRRVDLEKEKHQNCMQETEKMTLSGFQTGFCRVFESMTEFSRAALKMYNELSSNEKVGNSSFIEEGAKVEENVSHE